MSEQTINPAEWRTISGEELATCAGRELSDDELRALIEVPESGQRYTFPYTITPRFVAEKLGDGKRWVEIMPVEYAPNYYVLRVDSAWDTEEGLVHDALIRDHIDEIEEAIEMEYWDERDPFEECDQFPYIHLEMGVSWEGASEPPLKRIAAAQKEAAHA